MLLGKTGVGKSSSGNIILRGDVFTSHFSPYSKTQHCQIARGQVDGRVLRVIDTPGLLDSNQSEAESRQEIEKCISLCSPGPHVFLLVVRLGSSFTQEEQKALKDIESIFGEGSAKYTIVLFTHGDNLEGGVRPTIDEIISTNISLRDLIDQCNGGYHVFNNRDLNNYSQVGGLLQKIDRMVAVNGGSHYTSRSQTFSVIPHLGRGRIFAPHLPPIW